MIDRSQRTQSSAPASQIERSPAALTQPQKRAHMAALFKGKTVFSHARLQRLAARRAQAHKLAQRLGVRKPGMAKTTHFAHTAKTVTPGGRPAGKTVASKKPESRKSGREREDTESGSPKERQDQRQEDPEQQQQQQQKHEHSDEEPRHKAKDRAESDTRVGGLNKAAVPDWLAHTVALPAGPERQQAVAEACCLALLSLRQELGTYGPPTKRAGLYRHLQQMQNVRSALGPLPGAGLGAIRQRLIDGAATRPASEIEALVIAAGKPASTPVDAASRERLRSFNLLAGLMLLWGERPVTRQLGERAACIVGSLVAAREAPSKQ